MELVDIFSTIITIYFIFFIVMDTIFYKFGSKAKIADLDIECISNSRSTMFAIKINYNYLVDEREYSSKIINFSFFPSSKNKKKVEEKINYIKSSKECYIFPLFPRLSCILPLFYSRFFLFLIILSGPIALFLF